MRDRDGLSRRAFLGTTACAMAGAVGVTAGVAAGGVAQAAQASVSGDAASGSCAGMAGTTSIAERHYYLSEVRLEEGFEYEGDTVIGTRTGLYTLEIEEGAIVGVIAQDEALNEALNEALPRYLARGQLLLPAFRDLHIHLDKTFYGGPWQAPRPRQGKTIMDMIALEERLLPQLLPTSQERAEGLIALLLSKGSTVARSHCNIDPVSGLRSLEHLQLALENHRDDFACEIVAFPQHGLLNSNVDGLMREAMGMGVQYVGGLDPTNVDGAMEASLDAMFQIALDHDAKVDIHLHETGPAGVAAVDYMLDTVEANPVLAGRLTISHAFALTELDEGALEETATRLAAQGVTIASTVPLGSLAMPLPRLREKGVSVVTGTDSVIDHWSPFGTGDMLEKANLYAQLYRGSDEYHLSRALSLATGGVLPLDADGRRAWPAAGDPAEFVLVNASCSAEAVARLPAREATFHRGRLVAGAVARA